MKKKLVSMFLVGAMAASLLAGCGGSNKGAANTEGGSESENVTYSNEQIIIGHQTETSGDYTPFWTNNASDYSVYKMVTGLENVSVTREGKWIVNETVVKECDEAENEDGSKTYTFTLNDNLKFSNGEQVTAKDYVASILFWYSNELVEDLEASEATSMNAQYLVGSDAYLSGESDTFEGIHLVDDMTFSLTVDAQYLPYYYGKSLVSADPLYMPGWLPEDVVVEETEDGVKFSDNFTAEYIADSVEAYRYHPEVFTGAYMIKEYDENAYAYTLVKNPEFVGNYEGQTANIETVIYKYVQQDTMLDQLKTGAIDVLLQCADGGDIDAGLDLVDEGGFGYITMPRAGYGMISFKCNQGPTQFTAVRQAIMHLLDRNAFAQTFTGGHGTVVNGPYGSSQWMVNEYAEEVANLNSYSYSKDKAEELLIADGWTLAEDGSEYAGEGLRYKEVNGELMPLEIQWFSSENNSVSDLLLTSLANNPDVEAVGMKITQTVGTFNDLITYYYDVTEENPYQMLNLASGFGNPYDVAYSFEPGSGSNLTQVQGEDGQELYDLAVAMNQCEEGDDEAYGEAWLAFITKWNELVPEVPLYSNEYHDFFSDKVHDWNEDGYNYDDSVAVLYANVE
ncbi:MAG: ABC transporter substrate-binding protein [Agathobacter sp.]|nr:ABC transporter substrate-binding protein [Agathobacter sp.]